MDEFEKIVYPPELPKEVNLGGISTQNSRLQNPLNVETLRKLSDANGRIVDESGLKRAIFRGGIEPSLRRRIWPLLFGVYSFDSTEREKEALNADYCAKYAAMKQRWQVILKSHHDKKVHSPSYLECIPHSCIPNSTAAQQNVDSQPKQQMQVLFIQAQVFAGRQNFDLEDLARSVRIIDKDVPRTDRSTDFFRGDDNVHLRMLRDLLITYAAFHPEVGYAQGMNDIAGRFLVVTESEELSYWCLVKFMEHMKQDFVEDGMLYKLKLVHDLLSEMDKDLLAYLRELSVDDLTFCHRWMILSFKREFELEDSLKCFEILSSRHLELSSVDAQKAQEGHSQIDFETSGGTNRVVAAPSNTEFSFEVFMCATILMLYRDRIFQCQDTTDVFSFISSLTLKMDLGEILDRSESLFYSYCKKSVTDCFQLVELPSPDLEHSPCLDKIIDSAVSSSPSKNNLPMTKK